MRNQCTLVSNLLPKLVNSSIIAPYINNEDIDDENKVYDFKVKKNIMV
ncbi:12570_t:CDS:2 [Rhizophagus irregularis]|nr:12570_t:CDS:2 [Rhizophagus irregularis]